MLLAIALLTTGALARSIVPYASLAGRSDADIELFARMYPSGGAQPPPPPLKDTKTKLVNDAAHPFIAPKPGQMRGPCPGMNTLANHGYIPRSGIATPQQIITASEEAFGMGNDLAIFVTFAGMLVDGNHVTNLLSIGGYTPEEGPATPGTAGGLANHGTFEGDASLTRLDAHFGSNVAFNEGLFDQWMNTSNRVGNGTINFDSAAQHRFDRIIQSRDTNPDFFFDMPRFAVSYAEASFTIAMFVDGRGGNNQTLDYVTARKFFQENHMPEGFHRRDGAFSLADLGNLIGAMQTAHPVDAGSNVKNPNGTFTFVVDPDPTRGLPHPNCALYEGFVNTTERLYPNPKGALRDALKKNLNTYFGPIADLGCTQIFPYGK